MIRETVPTAFLCVIAALVISVSACGSGTERTDERAPAIPVIEIQSDDPELQSAVAVATRLVHGAPLDPDAWFELGRVLLANGLYTDAVGIFDRALELQPGHRDAGYLKAVSQHHLGLLQEAVVTLDGLSKAGATDAAMERSLAQWSLELGDTERAEAAAERAIELDPTGRGGHALLARCYIESGRPAEACAHLEPLIESSIRHRYLDFLYATALTADGRQAEAKAFMPGAAPAPPLWPDPHQEVVSELAAGYPTAIRETKEWLNAGEIDRALPRAHELNERNPDSVAAAILYALCLRNSGRFDDAMDVLNAALDRRPRHPELLYQAAAVLTMAAQVSGSGAQLPVALVLAEASIEVDPERFESHGVAGAVLLSMGRLDEALAEFERCADIDPMSPANCPTKVGNILIMIGRADEGLAVLQEAVERQPLEAAPTVTYAVQLKAAGRQDELDALMDRLEAGGSAFSDLRRMVEATLASGKTIEPLKLSSGDSD